MKARTSAARAKTTEEKVAPSKRQTTPAKPDPRAKTSGVFAKPSKGPEKTSARAQKASTDTEKTLARAEKTPPRAEKTSPRAEKSAPAAEKTSSRAEKSAPAAEKTALRAEKSAPAAEKTALRAEKTPPRGEKSAARGEKARGPEAVDATRYRAAVRELDALSARQLTRPSRPPRDVRSVDDVLVEARARIVLGYLHRDVLAPTLPKPTSAFFAQAWKALRTLETATREADETPHDAAAALARLVDELVIVRAVVQRHTPPGSDARAAVLTGQRLQPRAALVPLAEKVLAGARSLRDDFDALDDETLDRAAQALDEARAAVLGRDAKRAEETVLRTGRSEQLQLALDVLLYSTDHLATAALTRLRGTLPELRERLIAPIEKGPRDDDADTPTPTPEPTPAPAPAPKP